MKNMLLIINSVEVVFILCWIFFFLLVLVIFVFFVGFVLLWIKDLVILKMRVFIREMMNSVKRNIVERVYSGKFLLMWGVSVK